MRAGVVLSSLVLGGYLLAARGVGNLYPLSTFPMYAHAGGSMSRIMARVDGDYLEVTELVDWRCDNLPHLEEAACGGTDTIGYVDAEREAHIRAHPGDGTVPVELVRRLFSFDGVQRPPHCVLTHCRAARR